jgi:hypothetical protein
MSASSLGTVSGQFFQPADWFSSPTVAGTSTASSSGSSWGSASGSSGSDSWATSDSEADIPILLPVPFEELSSIQYFTTEEQLQQLTAALKEQFPRHCFIKIHSQKTQAMLVPAVEEFYTPRENHQWYVDKLFESCHAISAAEADALIEAQEAALLQTPTAAQETKTSAEAQEVQPDKDPTPLESVPPPRTIWNRTSVPASVTTITGSTGQQHTLPRKRGPKPDMENHAKVAQIISGYGEDWTTDESLWAICETLDQLDVPVPKTWPLRADGRSHSWRRAFDNYPHLVVKAIKDRCKMANTSREKTPSKLPQISAEP